MIIFGVDPGVSGAISVLENKKIIILKFSLQNHH